MRVIGGCAGGRVLHGPPDAQTRATSDKVRGAIFNVLAAHMAGARVLDLYAGTGALGIEALSRGAAACLFVERAGAACRVIDANLRATRLASTACVWCTSVLQALESLESAGEHEHAAPAPRPRAGMAVSPDQWASGVVTEGRDARTGHDRGASPSRVVRPFAAVGSTFWPPYDVIMLDPPYNDADAAGVVERVGQASILAPGGFVVLEHGKRLVPPHEPGGLHLCRTRRYGDTAVTIWQQADAGQYASAREEDGT